MSATEPSDELENNDGAAEAAPRRRKRIKLTPEQQELAEQYVALARTLTKPFKAAIPRCIEDFNSAAFFALVEAAQSFDPTRNVKFATFARFRITGALRDVKRRIKDEKHARDLPNVPRTFRYVPGVEERGPLMLTSFEPPVSEVVASNEEVEHWIGSLPERHAVACRELYLNYRTQGAVALKLGCSKSRVSYLHAEALDMLRQTRAVQVAAAERGLDSRRN